LEIKVNRNPFQWILVDKCSIESLPVGITGDQDKIETHSNRFPVDKSSIESLNIGIKGGQVSVKTYSRRIPGD
jgi:hypothetical protein